jgi:hypothetical protein
MTWRRVVFYWLCFAGLSLYYVIAVHEPAGEAAAHLTRAPFLDVPANDIDGLELRRGTAVVRCRREAGRWQVVEPAGRTVPSDLVAALVTNLCQLPDVEVVAEASKELGQFGLDPPVSQLVLTRPGGALGAARPITVRIGNRNPAGTAVYAQRDDDARVFLIGLNVRYYEDLLFEAVRAPGTTGSSDLGG